MGLRWCKDLHLGGRESCRSPDSRVLALKMHLFRGLALNPWLLVGEL